MVEHCPATLKPSLEDDVNLFDGDVVLFFVNSIHAFPELAPEIEMCKTKNMPIVVVPSSSHLSRDAVNDENNVPQEKEDKNKLSSVFLTPRTPKSRNRESTAPKKKAIKRKYYEEEGDAPGPSAKSATLSPVTAASPAIAARAAAAAALAAATAAAVAAAEAAVESPLDPSWSDEQKLRVLKRKRDRLMQQWGTINARIDWMFPDQARASDGVNCEGAGLFSFTSHRRREMFERERKRVDRDIRTGKTTRAQREKEAAKMRVDLNDYLKIHVDAVQKAMRPLAVALGSGKSS